jgi:hypothetical protein
MKRKEHLLRGALAAYPFRAAITACDPHDSGLTWRTIGEASQSDNEENPRMLPCRHVYLPYAEAAARPNILVDGASNEGTVLTLSHWPKSGTPWPLKADTSVGIVFNYIDDPAWHRDVPAVTNNHFDADGLVGLYCLIEPEHALKHRALLLDVASAGDFAVCHSETAARIAFAISRLVDRDLSPWGVESFPKEYPAYSAFVYTRVLQVLGGLIEDVEEHRELWADKDAQLQASAHALASGEVAIEERPEIDLAIVRVPSGWPDRPEHGFARHLDVPIHRMAVYNRTSCNRVASLCGKRISFTYRYESWVQTISRRPPPRIDLSPLAAQLSKVDSQPWHFDGVEKLTPSLEPDGIESDINHDHFLAALVDALHNGKATWNPYDDKT